MLLQNSSLGRKIKDAAAWDGTGSPPSLGGGVTQAPSGTWKMNRFLEGRGFSYRATSEMLRKAILREANLPPCSSHKDKDLSGLPKSPWGGQGSCTDVVASCDLSPPRLEVLSEPLQGSL